MQGLLIVLIPLFIGYFIPAKTLMFIKTKSINIILMLCLYAILFIMGFELGKLDNLWQQLPHIASYSLTFILLILACNMISLMIFDKKSPVPIKAKTEKTTTSSSIIWDSLKLIAIVLVGLLIGYISPSNYQLPNHSTYFILVVMIFLVGVQLARSGITIRQVILNKQGIYTALIMVLSSLIGGMLSALWLGQPIIQGLAISSGLGWYSLSSVIINDAWGAFWGSIAFFTDLSREIISLFIIPALIIKYRSTAIGIAGATALDCTLPIIQRSGGIELVPLAISFGFITNIIPPVLLMVFTS